MEEIKLLNKRQNIEQNKKLVFVYKQFEKLLSELRKEELPDEVIVFINNEIDQINSITESEKELKQQVIISKNKILQFIKRKLKLVTKNHYQGLWMLLGMSLFGIPYGIIFGMLLGNMAFLGAGIPIGMIIGMSLGSSMDRKALKEGRQLDI